MQNTQTYAKTGQKDQREAQLFNLMSPSQSDQIQQNHLSTFLIITV